VTSFDFIMAEMMNTSFATSTSLGVHTGFHSRLTFQASQTGALVVSDCIQRFTPLVGCRLRAGISGKCFPREGKLWTVFEGGTPSRMRYPSPLFSSTYQFFG
jgi:hypothetical protein